MAWSAQTLSTLNGIAKYEAEINQMAGSYTRPTLTLTKTGYLKFEPAFSSTDLTALYIDDQTEVLAAREGGGFDIVDGGECVEIYDTDNPYVFPTTAGSGTTVYDTTGTVYLDIANSSDVAWNNAIIHNTWTHKITVAKQLIGDEIKKQLAIKNWRDSDVESGEILDYVDNEETLYTASDYLTLHLIYIDLYATQPTEAYKEKANYYYDRYNTALQKALYQITFTISGTAYPLFQTYGSRLVI